MELKKLRKDLRISREELARKMKVKREFITRIESGEQNITIETLNKVAEATGKNFEFHFQIIPRLCSRLNLCWQSSSRGYSSFSLRYFRYSIV